MMKHCKKELRAGIAGGIGGGLGVLIGGYFNLSTPWMVIIAILLSVIIAFALSISME